MALPQQTANILNFLGYVPGVDVEVSSSGGVISIEEWNHVDPQPSERAITDAGNDLTTVRGQTFSQWRAEHGGDETQTKRREAKGQLVDASSDGVALRAQRLVYLDEINELRSRALLPNKTERNLLDAVRAKIDAGDADS